MTEVEIGFKIAASPLSTVERTAYHQGIFHDIACRTDLEARLALAEAMAREAGAVALDYFKRRETLVIETKRDPQDVVSIADREVENLIRERIAAAFPKTAILGEEYGVSAGTSGYTWVVDPIDGTSPFVNGMPNWCVSIAVLHDEEPVIGVIYAPCHDELYAAAVGMGATLNGKVLKLDPSRTIRNAVTGIGANNHVTPAFVGDDGRTAAGSGRQFHPQRLRRADACLCRRRPTRRLLRALYARLGLHGRILPRQGGRRLVSSLPDQGRR